MEIRAGRLRLIPVSQHRCLNVAIARGRDFPGGDFGLISTQMALAPITGAHVTLRGLRLEPSLMGVIAGMSVGKKNPRAAAKRSPWKFASRPC